MFFIVFIEEIFSDDLHAVIFLGLYLRFYLEDESCHFLFLLIFLQTKIKILQKNLPNSFISAALNKVETMLELVLKGASLIKNLRR